MQLNVTTLNNDRDELRVYLDDAKHLPKVL